LPSGRCFHWVNAGANLLLDTGDRSAVWEQSRALVIVNYATFSLAIVITFEPVRTAPTLDALERQHRLLGAADALEKRAHAIHEWPIDEGTVARVIRNATRVIGITLARLILDPFGL
jgi:hypothetical protein